MDPLGHSHICTDRSEGINLAKCVAEQPSQIAMLALKLGYGR